MLLSSSFDPRFAAARRDLLRAVAVLAVGSAVLPVALVWAGTAADGDTGTVTWGVGLAVVAAVTVGWAVWRIRRRADVLAELWALQAGAHDSGVSADPGTWPVVEELVGWKVARLVGSPVPRFIGLYHGSYTTSATAVCAHQDHDAPEPECTRGFYAFTDARRARRARRRNPGSVLLSVEGYGPAVEHELGWRAAQQEVLTVFLPGRCRRCLRPADGLAMVPLFDAWYASCEPCARRRGRTFASLPTLRGWWGTEVRLLPRRLPWLRRARRVR